MDNINSMRRCLLKTAENSIGMTLVEVLVALIFMAIITTGINYTMHAVTPQITAAHKFALQRNALSIKEQLVADLRNTDPVGFTVSASSMVLPQKRGLPNVTYTITGTPQRIDRATAGITYNLLESWDNGRIDAGVNTAFKKKIDVDGDSKISLNENNMVQVTLNLMQMETIAGTEGALSAKYTQFIFQYFVTK